MQALKCCSTASTNVNFAKMLIQYDITTTNGSTSKLINIASIIMTLLKPRMHYDVTITSRERGRPFDLTHETFNRSKNIDEIYNR